MNASERKSTNIPNADFMRVQGGKPASSRELYNYIINKDGHVIIEVMREKAYY